MYRWNSSAPIYQQLADYVVASLLDAGAEDGAALPSVRDLAKTYMVNPHTVSRALERLRGNGWVETHHGVGTFVAAGARARIVEFGRKKFVEEEWPTLRQKLRRLDIQQADLH